MTDAATAPPPIRVLVVDDEPLARRGARRLLASDPEVQVVGDCGTGAEAVRLVRALAPDLLLLDVQMPEMDGFAVIEALEAQGAGSVPAVVFVTAHDRHAVRAFDVRALDYVLKPFDDERFARAIARAKAQVRQGEVARLGRRLASLLGAGQGAPAAAEPPGTPGAALRDDEPPPSSPSPSPSSPAEPLARLLVRVGDRTIPVRMDDVDWIEAADYCVRLHAGGRALLHRESLTRLESRLDPARWVRVHRSAMVNVERVRELQPYVRGDQVVILRDGTRLRLSRSRKEALVRALGRGG